MPIYENDPPAEPNRCVIVVDNALSAGRAANAAAVLAFTLGKRHADLAGVDLVDASGHRHPGLIPIGIAVLSASNSELSALRNGAIGAGIDVVDFPTQGQATTDYGHFGAQVALVPSEELSYVGIGLLGPRKAVGRIIGKCPLL
jgi:Protein of unknown function (DUF2000)